MESGVSIRHWSSTGGSDHSSPYRAHSLRGAALAVAIRRRVHQLPKANLAADSLDLLTNRPVLTVPNQELGAQAGAVLSLRSRPDFRQGRRSRFLGRRRLAGIRVL